MGIGTEHSDNLGAAHTRSGGRKQPVCGVRLFLLGFKTALWNRVETATINDLHERVQSILEDYNLCQAGQGSLSAAAANLLLCVCSQ